MDIGQLLDYLIGNTLLTSPLTFAILVGVAAVFVWFALSPSKEEEDGRLNGYLHGDALEDVDMRRSFLRRALIPAAQTMLQFLGRLTPASNIERLRRLLVHAGSPAGLSAPDVLGLQILATLGAAGIYVLIVWVVGRFGSIPPLVLARNALLLGVGGLLLPRLWLRFRANRRRREILRTFSDALDLLSVSVEAGLAFDSALMRVCERWRNALTEELQRVVVEMRVGTPRNVALQRMADRTGVREVETFVGVLIQSSELGMSISQTLHTQAAQVRLWRRHHAEELARQASVKMIFALVFLIFPALLVVLLGPGVPAIFEALQNVNQ